MQLVSNRVHCGRSGKSQEFYKFIFPSWVNIIALTSSDEIVLIRQYRYGTDRVELEIPGGAVNEGEDPLAAGERELLEETGYVGINARVIGRVCPNPAIQNNFCYTVLVENAKLSATPEQDDMEDIEVLTLPKKDLDDLITGGSLEHGLVLNALMFFGLEMAKVSD